MPCPLFPVPCTFIPMHIKIYFNDKPLFLCDKIDETIEPFIHHDDAVLIDELNTHAIKSMIHEMQQPSVHAGIYIHNNLDELKKNFFKKFVVIQAGGGFVENEKKDMLMIFRRGKWDLPKGKLDKGETMEQCAIREVQEETGLKNVQSLEHLAITYHTYEEGTKHILKESHWFRMKANGDQELTPQVAEGIEKIIWTNNRGMKEYLDNSFPSVVDVIKAGMKKNNKEQETKSK